MRILLVDDGGGKYGALVELVAIRFPDQVEIVHARSRAAALRFLKLELFPLMILDLYLPRQDVDTPEEMGGLLLIEAIEANATLFTPWNLIAVSREDVTPQDECGIKLKEKNIPFFHCPDQSEVAYDALANEIAKLLFQESKRMLVPTDFRSHFLVVATLRSEFNAVLEMSESGSRCEIPVGCERARAIKVLAGDGSEISIIVVQLTGPGPVAAATGVLGAISLFAPRMVILVGICGGVKGESKIGDLVVASEIVDYTRGKIVSRDKEEYFEPESPSISTDIERSTIAISGEDAELLLVKVDSSIDGVRPSQRPRLICGQVASGNQVVGRAEAILDIKTTRFRKLKAIEMEGWGALWSCKSTKRLRPNFLLIKSVSDLSDEGKGDEFHHYCSCLSAGFAIGMITALWV